MGTKRVNTPAQNEHLRELAARNRVVFDEDMTKMLLEGLGVLPQIQLAEKIGVSFRRLQKEVIALGLVGKFVAPSPTRSDSLKQVMRGNTNWRHRVKKE